MVEQKRGTHYTMRTPAGREIPVKRLSREDVERELAEFEAKYGMTSQEFADRWNRGELDCGVIDYFDWSGDCDYMASEHGVKELEVIHTNVQELKIE